MAGLEAETGGPFQIRIELARPGLAHVPAPPEYLLPDALAGGWPGVIDDLPYRLRPTPRLPAGSLDLVLLVELGGAKDKGAKDVAARVGLVRRVVREFRDVPGARIAVLGYRDHFGHHDRDKIGVPGQEREALVVGSTGGFSTPGELRSMFRQAELWRPVPVGEDHAAPVEEALWMIADDAWGWRPDTRHVVLIIGRRPPHPARPQARSVIRWCHNNLSWREALKRLRMAQALECFAVLDDNPAPGYASSAWRALTAQGRLRIARCTTAPMLAQDCGLAPRSPAQLCLATLAGAASLPTNGQQGAP
jgi:hypothetical protein